MATQVSLLLLGLVCLLPALSLAAECHGKPDPNAKPNLNPIYTQSPVFVRQVKNAKLYTLGDGEDMISVVHLWGTAYERGFALGSVVKDAATGMMNGVWDYLKLQVIEALNGTGKYPFQPWFLNDVSQLGLETALDLEIEITKKFSPPYFEEEIHGMADATGLDYKKILRIHMIGELTKASCSMFGAWNTALGDKNGLLQLRALDWNIDGPFQNFPQITVYHTSNASTEVSFINIGWTGWIGSITGVNSQRLAISEIGVSFPDDTFGKESRFGIPFTYLLRDVLQFDRTIDDSINRIANAHRTCDLILGVGDGKLREFRGIQYSASVANFYDDMNMQPTADWHPRIQDTVYWGMDWLCPGYSEILARQLAFYHGSLTAELAIFNVTSVVQTGDLHVALYDLGNNFVYIANARGATETGPLKAYDRTFVRGDLAALFAELPPNV